MTDRTRTGPLKRLGSLWRNTQGSVAVIFAITATTLVIFMGAGLDLSRAYVARQELSNVATMACQYSERPSVYQVAYSNNNGVTTYQTQVNTFANKSLAAQKLGLTQGDGSAPGQYSSNYTYSGLGGTGSIALSAQVPTFFLPIAGIPSIHVGVTTPCGQGQTQNQGGGGATPGSIVMAESFENSACSGTCWSTFQPNGTQNNVSPTTQNSFTNTVAYVGASGSEWSLMGYCLEVDAVGLIKSTVPDGSHSAELDCDNGSGTAGNSSISNKSFYAAGTYEIRYNYASRVQYPNYDPTYICGSSTTDVAWANDGTETGSPRGANISRSNQLQVYFDADQNGVGPTHTTIDGTETLGGSNLIDVCVYSTNWVQRSIKITVATAGYYWISFAADGGNDSYGAQIDNILVCNVACNGAVNDNFPTAWNSTPLLFEDSFASPSSSTSTVNTAEVLDNDYGASSNGWPNQGSYGWATGPYNQVGIVRTSALVDSGSQSLEFDSDKSGSETTSRRSISRYFYLDPGYYAVSYDYISAVKFTSVTGTNCTYTPSSASALSSYSTTTLTAGKNLVTGGSGTSGNWPKDTNAVAVFMSHVQEVSSPVGGGALNSATKYFNPDGVGGGTTSTTATTAPDAVSTSSYNTAQLNPVLDYCNYASSWTTRTTYVQITKAGQYYLTIGAVGASASQDKVGGVIDDVKLTAYASPYGTAPSFFVTIPTPGPAVSSSKSFTGFSMTSDPFKP